VRCSREGPEAQGDEAGGMEVARPCRQALVEETDERRSNGNWLL